MAANQAPLAASLMVIAAVGISGVVEPAGIVAIASALEVPVNQRRGDPGSKPRIRLI